MSGPVSLCSAELHIQSGSGTSHPNGAIVACHSGSWQDIAGTSKGIMKESN